MDPSATPILEIGAILLAAAGGGWLARRVGLPAIVGYLAVGLGFSPFTPGYVADRQQLELLANVGVVLLLFEVGIEVDLRRLRREHGPLLWVAPLQTVLTTGLGGAAFVVVGLDLRDVLRREQVLELGLIGDVDERLVRCRRRGPEPVNEFETRTRIISNNGPL